MVTLAGAMDTVLGLLLTSATVTPLAGAGADRVTA
jgi:hypothetical protein